MKRRAHGPGRASRHLAPRLLACAWLAACVDIPDFAERSIVDRPRVIAIVAEPPEVAPGEDVVLSALAVGGDDYRVRWSACGSLFALGGAFRGTQYGEASESQGCGGATTVELGEGASEVLDGSLGRSLFDDLELAAAVFGDLLPPGALESVRSQVGVPVVVEARVETSGTTLRAIKRVLINEREPRGENPPPPVFSIGDTEVTVRGDDPFLCTAEGDAVVRLPPDTEVELAPRVDGEEEPWLESYFVLDANGELSERHETGFYSWFSTAGSFEQEVTKTPLQNELWTTPPDAGCYPLWLVVRDGHGGTSPCGVWVRVGEGGACPEEG